MDGRHPLWQSTDMGVRLATVALGAAMLLSGCGSDYWAERGNDALDVFDVGITVGHGIRFVAYPGLPVGFGFQMTGIIGGYGRDWVLAPHGGGCWATLGVFDVCGLDFGFGGHGGAPRGFGGDGYAMAGPLCMSRGRVVIANSLPIGFEVNVFLGVRLVFYPIQFVDLLLGFFGADIDP